MKNTKNLKKIKQNTSAKEVGIVAAWRGLSLNYFTRKAGGNVRLLEKTSKKVDIITN